MLKPPFKLATPTAAASATVSGRLSHFETGCCDGEGLSDSTGTTDTSDETNDQPITPAGRARLGDLDPHIHCSVIGTCLGTGDLRKLMARFLFVRDSSDLEVHHESVRLASHGGAVSKALHKALDQRHAAAIQRFARAHDAPTLAALWEEALRQGEIPGAYWAVLTHRDVTSELRQKVFGDVHMLSHLVGAANRADIRRLLALERENTELRERTDRQQTRAQELLDERDRAIATLREQLAEAEAERAKAATALAGDSDARAAHEQLAVSASLVALQTERRERAEQAAGVALNEATRLREELEYLGQHVQALGRELTAAEAQIREIGGGADSPGRTLEQPLHGRRVFYVGGRPSSTPAIRDLVLRHGGEFQSHDGGLEDRKGLLASGVAWADMVVFPVDCIDHDSATNLKRLCLRQQVLFVPLRSASVASFAAGVAQPHGNDDGDSDRPTPTCLKHG